MSTSDHGASAAAEHAAPTSRVTATSYSETEATAETPAPPVEDPSVAAPVRDCRLKWEERAPSPPETVELRVPAKAYFFFKDFDMKDIKALRPCGNGVTKQVQQQLKATLDNFYKQPYRWDGEDHVIVTEMYKTSNVRFPGDLHSSGGSQGLWRPIRSNLLSETADADMKVAMPTILLWVCKQFGIVCPNLEWYVSHREDALAKLMADDSCTRPHAKEQFNLPYTWEKKLHGIKNTFLKDYDVEAKRVQQELMARAELAWILPFCDPEGASNRSGSFVCKLFHFVQARLIRRVMHLLREEEGERIACIVFDGLNVANKARHGDEPLLAKCTAACEEVCPGINMGWAWKELDYEVRTKDKKVRVPDKSEGKVLIVDGNLCIPDAYEPPGPPDEDGENDGAGGDVALDPRYEPTYDDMFVKFSLPDGPHGKVGPDYIEVLDEDDVHGRGKKLMVYGKDKFIARHEDMVYYELAKRKDEDGNEFRTKEVYPFINRWIKDPKKDAQYLRDPSRKCKWEYFDMHPLPSTCPSHCYNLWRGFAVDAMTLEVDLGSLEPEVAQRLERILEHFRMLCRLEGDAHESFLLDWLAHIFQHPNKKVGIALCMVGKRGCGKTSVWEILQRLIGRHASFAPMDPKKDAWGDNNDNMRSALVVRIVEAAKKAFAGDMGKVRTLITEEEIRVRSLYGASQMVKSYIRFFMDTDQFDSIPDEDGERRFFVVCCNPEMIGNEVYWTELREAINDDRVIRALYLTLLRRAGVKERYFGPDIPVGEYARTLKDANRPHNEKFLIWLVQQHLDKTELVRDVDQLYERDFRSWKEAGGEFDRSKASFTSWLRLRKFDLPKDTIRERRVIKPKESMEGEIPTPSHFNGQPVQKDTKQVTEFRFDIAQLRKHYRISIAEPVGPGLNLGDSVLEEGDDEQVADATDEGGGGGAHDTGQMDDDDDEDDDDLEPGERGRRMHARGEAPPSPHPENADVRRGYEQAVATAAAGPSSLLAGGSTTAATIIVPGVSAGRSAHDGPQTQEEVDRTRAERQQRQQANGKQRARPDGAGGPTAKKQRQGSTATADGPVVSVALVHTGRVLLTRETRSGKTLLNLPGGKSKGGETPGQTAAREAHEETGEQLSERTRAAIANITNWVESDHKQGLVGVLHLADDDPDGTVDARFDRAAANAQHGSKTAQEGLVWHPLADVRSGPWRSKRMHYPGQHRAAAAVRAVGGPTGAAGRPAGGGGGAARGGLINLAGVVAAEPQA